MFFCSFFIFLSLSFDFLFSPLKISRRFWIKKKKKRKRKGKRNFVKIPLTLKILFYLPPIFFVSCSSFLISFFPRGQQAEKEKQEKKKAKKERKKIWKIWKTSLSPRSGKINFKRKVNNNSTRLFFCLFFFFLLISVFLK